MPVTLQSDPKAKSTSSAGRRPEKAKSVQDLPSHEPMPNFLLMAHPARWQPFETDEGTELLPCLGYIVLEPGVGGVTQTGDDSMARVRARKRGWIIVEDDFVDDGYVRAHDVKQGVHHCTKWQKPVMAGGKAIHKLDQAGYWDFLRRVAVELLPEPEPEILDLIKDVQVARLSRQLENAEKIPGRAKAATATQKRIDALDNVILPNSGDNAEQPDAEPATAKKGAK